MRESKKRANAKYDAVHYAQIKIKLHKEIDKDILDWLAERENKNGYMKELIRKDIKAGK